MTALEAMGAGIAGKLLLLPLFAVGYLMYLILTSDRRKKTPQQQEPEPGTRQMTDGKRFNDIGFLSPDLVVWASQVRAEFDASFDVADRFNRLGMRLLFDIPTENIDDAKAMATAAYGRAIKSFQAALLLSQIGALAEARALVRVSTEAVILVGALKADPNVTDQMREDVAYHKCALFNSLLEGADGEKPDEEQAASFRAILDGIAQEYPDRKPKTMN